MYWVMSFRQAVWMFSTEAGASVGVTHNTRLEVSNTCMSGHEHAARQTYTYTHIGTQRNTYTATRHEMINTHIHQVRL